MSSILSSSRSLSYSVPSVTLWLIDHFRASAQALAHLRHSSAHLRVSGSFCLSHIAAHSLHIFSHSSHTSQARAVLPSTAWAHIQQAWWHTSQILAQSSSLAWWQCFMHFRHSSAQILHSATQVDFGTFAPPGG